MPADNSATSQVVQLPLRAARSTLAESLASTAPWLFVALLLLALALVRLFSQGRSGARRAVRWFIRYWQAFFGLNYNPTKKSNLRKRHSR